jgi:DNA-nicking Smr family endonuclease
VSARDPRRRKLTAEERRLWGRVTRSVAPLPQKPLGHRLEPAALPGKSPAKPAPVIIGEAPSGPKRAPALEAFDRRLKQRLARGRLGIDDRIDLHGKTQNQAHSALLRFLRRAQADGAKFVLVITGKGLRGSEARSERGVLNRQVPLWLSLPDFQPYVSGFETAHVGHGGEGALYVRLRRPHVP